MRCPSASSGLGVGWFRQGESCSHWGDGDDAFTICGGFVPAYGGRHMVGGSLDADLQAFVGERNCHLFAPFHEDDGACARFFEFLVEAEGFEFVEEQVGLCLTWGVVIGSKPVGIHVDQMCARVPSSSLAMVKVGETMGS